ncbi:Branched-chain-amino-acid aminotransferase, mitochondrial [Myotis brandtii]|uniref:Branched-chain-amino-acid aminotransferase n=1 Tax=Myotis brandtii TaxID=109478 RepID=S7NHE1_MYOBR|nr:Branched-chain-amino-acid aminotransferase, mitochondrial [Myotis brandtii]
MFGGIVGGECGAQAEEAIRDTEKLRGWDCVEALGAMGAEQARSRASAGYREAPLRTRGGNYGPTVFVQQEAKKKGCEQVLWLYGPDHQLTEVGTMNIFVYWTHEDGVLELVTPPLEGVILPGVVRQSLLDLAHSWGEFRVVERKITMKELLRALKEGRVREVFGSGTACQVCPVHRVLYQGQDLHIPTMDHGPDLILRFQKELKAIQVPRALSPVNFVTLDFELIHDFPVTSELSGVSPETFALAGSAGSVTRPTALPAGSQPPRPGVTSDPST